jgi:hypothetical protein
MYIVEHYGYCGMQTFREAFGDRADARDYVAERLARFRRRFTVQTLGRGESWEILEPEGCMMVPDSCGTMRLVRVGFECPECGFEHDTKQEARECCAPEEDDCNA